ncbi:hypothetical protein CYLTODRAFT_447873 [Cylindrobasidium torrendii FP15055 ss-10]|uniref:Ribonuclease H1 N-terminal domain-containing protein n=1 Tax=Cylindrobasidium torrendii FP15055 ss-10 TaxID=1314674 RepID=A0A0D7ARX4_9AGAR|nr:hypothetical protein CYLTODRAFT_447873 [Cylindrobasidium torrendii FP15055 ss-10]
MQLISPEQKDDDDGGSDDSTMSTIILTSDSDYDTAPDTANDIGMWDIDPNLLRLMQSVELDDHGHPVNEQARLQGPSRRRSRSLTIPARARSASGGVARNRIRAARAAPAALLEQPARGTVAATGHAISETNAPARRAAVTALAGRSAHASAQIGDSITAPVARTPGSSHVHPSQAAIGDSVTAPVATARSSMDESDEDPPPPAYTAVDMNPVINQRVVHLEVAARPCLVSVVGHGVGVYPDTPHHRLYLAAQEEAVFEEYRTEAAGIRAYREAVERKLVGRPGYRLPSRLQTALVPLNAAERTVRNTAMVREGRRKRYYVVYFGRQPGIFDNWIEAGLSVYKIDTATNFPHYRDVWDITTSWSAARALFSNKQGLGRVISAHFD